MFVGYPTNCTCDTYHFLKEATNHVIETRDAIWLDRMYLNRRDQTVLLEEHDDEIVDPGDQIAADDGLDSDDEPNSSGVVKIEEANADEAATSGGTATVSAATSTATTTRSSRVSRMPVRLGDYETI